MSYVDTSLVLAELLCESDHPTKASNPLPKKTGWQSPSRQSTL